MRLGAVPGENCRNKSGSNATHQMALQPTRRARTPTRIAVRLAGTAQKRLNSLLAAAPLRAEMPVPDRGCAKRHRIRQSARDQRRERGCDCAASCPGFQRRGCPVCPRRCPTTRHGIGNVAHEQPRCPVLMHFGEKDHAIPLSDVGKVRSAHPSGALRSLFIRRATASIAMSAPATMPRAPEIARERSVRFLNRHLS
jgi:hypothetical protein